MTKKDLSNRINSLSVSANILNSDIKEHEARLNNANKLFFALIEYLCLDVVKERVIENGWIGEVIVTKYKVEKAKKIKKANK